jgi:hypothetical protein
MSSSNNQPKKILIKKKKPVYKKPIHIRTDRQDKTVEIEKDPNDFDESTSFSGLVDNNQEIDRHGYYLPPSTGRTIVMRKPRDAPLFVDKRIPLPPPLTEDQREGSRMIIEEAKEGVTEPTVRLPTVANIKSRREVQRRAFQEYEVESAREKTAEYAPKERKLRKFISSLGKTGSASAFTFDVSEPLKRIFKIKFVSVTISYVVPAAPPTNAFIYLDAFPLFENPSYYETDLGTKYSAHFPLITGTVGSTINMNYAFPTDYEMYLTTPSDTVNTFDIKLFKEDPTVTPGDIVDFSDVTYATFEIEFYVENLLL